MGNEAERRIEVQIPSFIGVAPTNGRFSRLNLVEETIGGVEKRSSQIWERVVDGVGRALKTDPSALRLPDQNELASVFFLRVRARCAAALKGRNPERLSARPFDLFFVWDYVSAALTYCFQREIAVANDYLKRINWFDDRVDTYLECRLDGWISSKRLTQTKRIYCCLERRAKIEMEAAIRAGINLEPVDMIWHFAINEIARQLDKKPSELLLPSWQTVAKAFFTKVEEMCAAGVSNEESPLKGTT